MQEFVDFLGKQAPYDKLDAEDLERLGEQGITEVFLDLNWDDSTVGADDEGAALANAERVLEQLAP